MKKTLLIELEPDDSPRALEVFAQAETLRSAVWEFDQDLRALSKYGETRAGELKSEHSDLVYEIRQLLHKHLDEHNILPLDLDV